MGFENHIIAKTLNANTYFTRPYTTLDKGSVVKRIGQKKSLNLKRPILLLFLKNK